MKYSLIRDAFFTGFNTVSIDYERLLTSLTIVLIEVPDGDKIDQYEIGYKKNAVSVIENVVCAHDAERKWIQNHPVVLYDMYILHHVMSQLNKHFSEKGVKIFSLQTLREEGIRISDETKIALLCDDDIIFLMKSINLDDLSKEYFNRKDRRHPLWKSEAEYKAYLLQLISEGEILKRLEKSLIATEKYVAHNSENGIINKALITKVEAEIERLTTLTKNKLPERDIKRQLDTKQSIYKIFKSLCDHANTSGEECDFVILGASQFYSGFNRPDIANINIVFDKPEGEKVSKFGKIVSLLNCNENENENFFYLYHKRKFATDVNKDKFSTTLIRDFMQ